MAREAIGPGGREVRTSLGQATVGLIGLMVLLVSGS